RALRPTDGPAAIGEARFPVDDDAALAFAGKVERGGEANRPCTDNGDRMTGRLRALLVGRAPVREPRFPDVGHLLVFEHPLVIYRNVEGRAFTRELARPSITA